MTQKKDPNFWKDQYQHTWEASAKREQFVQHYIEFSTGAKLLPVGLGTNSTKYIKGSARSNGSEKGAPDYRVQGTKLYIEVTGSGSKMFTIGDNLSIRPDKLQHARNHFSEFDTCVVYYLEHLGSLRAIPLNRQFFDRLDKGEFATVKVEIYGAMETYVEILADDSAVKPIGMFTKYISALLGKGGQLVYDR